MPKAATFPVATTRAALNAAQCKPYGRDLKGSSSEARSCIAGSFFASVSPYQGPVRPLQMPPTFYGSQDDVDASTIAAKAFTSSSGKSTLAKTGKWPKDHWFWLLLVSLPAKMEGRMTLIQTFNAYYYAKNVQIKNEKSTWTDPFIDFIFIACEIFVPYEPYGGRGSSRKISIFGDMKSRNETIAFILNLALGDPTYGDFVGESRKKIISSKIQTVMKTLLTNYNNGQLSAEVRHDAGLALKHLAQGTPLREFYDALTVKRTSSAQKWNSDALIRDKLFQTPTFQSRVYEVPSHEVALHPFLAFIISQNRFFIDDALLSASDFFFSTVPVYFFVGNLPAQAWWHRFVMVDSEIKANTAREWWRRELNVVGGCYQSRMVLADNFDKKFTYMRRGTSKLDIADMVDLVADRYDLVADRREIDLTVEDEGEDEV